MFNNSTVAAVPRMCSASIVDSTLTKSAKYVVFTSIMVAALLGNIFIIIVVYKKKSMRKTTNMFIANIAASDILIAFVVIPRMIVELYIGPRRWLISGGLGSFTCKFANFFADFSVCISMTSHAVIAVDRFWAIVYCLRPSPITEVRRKYIIAMIWIYSFILHSPNLYIYQLHNHRGKIVCRISWAPLDSFTSQKIYFSVILVFVISVPVLLMTALYTWLIVSLNNSVTHHPQIRQQRQKEDVMVLRKVAVLLSVFLFSCLPITILGIFHFYVWRGRVPCTAWTYSFMAHLLLLSNSAVNPWLCIVLQDKYRHHIHEILNWTKQLLCLDSSKANRKVMVYELGEASSFKNGKHERDSMVTMDHTT